jgi:TRAP-type C4-dicarboxylate transport system substrate-binding protein
MKKLFAVVALVAAFGAVQSVSAQSKAAKPVILKYGELNPDNHIMTVVAREFARLVKEKSGGQIIVDVYPSSQLGDERTEMQAVQMGAIDLFRANAVSMGDFGAKKSNIFSLPYLFRDREHLWKVLNGPIGKEIKDDVQASGSGMVAVAFMEEGQRHFFFRNAPVSNLARSRERRSACPRPRS